MSEKKSPRANKRPPTFNHELPIKMVGRKDRFGEDYYLAKPSIPCLVDLSRAALFFFPAEEADGDHFNGTLMIKLQREDEEPRPPRKTRRSRDDGEGEGGAE